MRPMTMVVPAGGLALAAMLEVACAASPASPEPARQEPPLTLSLSGPARTYVGATVGLAVDAERPITNLRCTSSNGDAVTISYDMLDWDVYGWVAWLHAATAGMTTVSCLADPNASGSVEATIVRATTVRAEYVRTYVPTLALIDPTIDGSLHVHANFRKSDGASEWLSYCSVALEWDAASRTFRCGVATYQRVIVDALSAVCVTDPASRNPAYQGGTFYVNGTRLTTWWSGATLDYQCMLFVIDTNGAVVSPNR